jgi:transposase
MPLTLFLGAKLIYLPLYLPDMNPIEETFLLMKAWL